MKSKTLSLILFMSATNLVYAEEGITESKHSISGSAAVVSKYIYRGAVENNDVALQFGLDYAHESGISLGYWGSNLDYNPSKEDKNSGFEHNFYIGYGRELNDDWSYNSQIVAYVYQNSSKVHAENGESRRTSAFELLNDVTYKDLSLGLAVMLADASFANAGDLYLSAAYSYPLPQDFSLNAAVGALIFNDNRDDAIVETTENFVLSEAKLGVSKEIANSNLNLSLDYIWGGKDRVGEKFDDHTIFSLTYSF